MTFPLLIVWIEQRETLIWTNSNCDAREEGDNLTQAQFAGGSWDKVGHFDGSAIRRVTDGRDWRDKLISIIYFTLTCHLYLVYQVGLWWTLYFLIFCIFRSWDLLSCIKTKEPKLHQVSLHPYYKAVFCLEYRTFLFHFFFFCNRFYDLIIR